VVSREYMMRCEAESSLVGTEEEVQRMTEGAKVDKGETIR